VTAATAADLRAGVTVSDAQGGRVGTVETADATGAVVSTGTVRARLPLSSFGKNAQGLVISLTQAQLNAAAQAQSGPQPTPGATPSDQGTGGPFEAPDPANAAQPAADASQVAPEVTGPAAEDEIQADVDAAAATESETPPDPQ
jgi:hypothetical protein